MTLRLRVVSDQRRSLGDRSSIVFTADGGTIGRSADNDWVLPDPLRYVSAHHARVIFRSGRFYLQDVSTNGVFINEEPEALNKRGADGYVLRNGDVLKIGDYQVVVALDAAVEQPLPAQDTGAAAVPTSIHALHTLGRAAQTDIGHMLNLDDLLVPESPTGEALLPVNAYGQAVMQGPVRALAAAPGATPAVVSLRGAPRIQTRTKTRSPVGSRSWQMPQSGTFRIAATAALPLTEPRPRS